MRPPSSVGSLPGPKPTARADHRVPTRDRIRRCCAFDAEVVEPCTNDLRYRDLGSVKLTESAAFWLAGYGVVSAVNVTSELFELHRLSSVSLFLAMPSLVATVLADESLQDSSWLVVAALLYSWLGDWVGDLGTTVVVKLVFFLAAHICYVAAFWPYRAGSILERWEWCVIFALVVGASVAWVAMRAGTMSPAVLVYGCSVGLMAGLATGVHPLTAAGAASFLVSDFLIALTTFVLPTRSRWAGGIIKASYLTGQSLIVFGTRARRVNASLNGAKTSGRRAGPVGGETSECGRRASGTLASRCSVSHACRWRPLPRRSAGSLHRRRWP